MATELEVFIREVVDRPSSVGSQDEAKRAAARAALELVEPGMTLGLGTGSTVEYFLQGLAERVGQGLTVRGVPTSKVTESRARELGIPLLGAPDFPQLHSNLCVDGADRVEPGGCLIKGGGGALFREKLVASHSERVCILVDPTKVREVFDQSFPVPVECLAFGIDNTLDALCELGCTPSLRHGGDFRTDNGNLIVDCQFARIPDPVVMALRLSALVGVVEVGLFCNLLDDLIVGFPDGGTLCWKRG
ncbi:MAG: ribose-5-phosphate isomerase RpiA [Vulcanimicrobiota bacterium]